MGYEVWVRLYTTYSIGLILYLSFLFCISTYHLLLITYYLLFAQWLNTMHLIAHTS